MSTIKQYDTYPYLEFDFLDAEGTPVDCSGYSVRLFVRNRLKEIVIDAIVGESDSGAVWLDENLGTGEYHWKDGDTDVCGVYEYEFEFTRLSDSRKFTLPSHDFYTYSVEVGIENGG